MTAACLALSTPSRTRRPCRLGVIRAGARVTWTNPRGAWRGRVTEFTYLFHRIPAVVVDVLPYTSVRKRVTLPLHSVSLE